MWPDRNNDLQKALTDQILTPEFSHLQKMLRREYYHNCDQNSAFVNKIYNNPIPHTQKTPKLYAGRWQRKELKHEKTHHCQILAFNTLLFHAKTKAFSSPHTTTSNRLWEELSQRNSGRGRPISRKALLTRVRPFLHLLWVWHFSSVFLMRENLK